METTTDAMPALAPLSASSRPSVVAEAIRTAILDGTLPPGRDLTERSLAEMLGVSKTPVREALITLARSGLVTIAANRGARVRVLDDEAVRAIYEVRLLLEPAAARSSTAFMTHAVETSARRTLEDAETAIAAGQYAQLSTHNRAFHRLVYAGCRNPIIVSTLDDLQDQLALIAVTRLWQETSSWTSEYDEHRKILDAILERDGGLVQDRVRSHIEESLATIGA